MTCAAKGWDHCCFAHTSSRFACCDVGWVSKTSLLEIRSIGIRNRLIKNSSEVSNKRVDVIGNATENAEEAQIGLVGTMSAFVVSPLSYLCTVSPHLTFWCYISLRRSLRPLSMSLIFLPLVNVWMDGVSLALDVRGSHCEDFIPVVSIQTHVLPPSPALGGSPPGCPLHRAPLLAYLTPHLISTLNYLVCTVHIS